MDEPVYLTLEEVIEAHRFISERTGSPPCPLLRPDTLDSALNRPRNAAYYEGADLVAQAVALAVGISQAQAFEDGNKRAAFAAADVFLRFNGLVFNGDDLEFARRLEEIADSDRSRRDGLAEAFANWLRENVRGAPRAH